MKLDGNAVLGIARMVEEHPYLMRVVLAWLRREGGSVTLTAEEVDAGGGAFQSERMEDGTVRISIAQDGEKEPKFIGKTTDDIV